MSPTQRYPAWAEAPGPGACLPRPKLSTFPQGVLVHPRRDVWFPGWCVPLSGGGCMCRRLLGRKAVGLQNTLPSFFFEK